MACDTYIPVVVKFSVKIRIDERRVTGYIDGAGNHDASQKKHTHTHSESNWPLAPILSSNQPSFSEHFNSNGMIANDNASKE